MQIRAVIAGDISDWKALSAEYDSYVKDLVGDTSEWYGGGGDSSSFILYMESKIVKQEAFLVAGDDGCCLGIVAFSKKNNRITFLAISHKSDFNAIGKVLMKKAIEHLDTASEIYINGIASPAEWITHHKALYVDLGFIPIGSTSENGVPVTVYAYLPAPECSRTAT